MTKMISLLSVLSLFVTVSSFAAEVADLDGDYLCTYSPGGQVVSMRFSDKGTKTQAEFEGNVFSGDLKDQKSLMSKDEIYAGYIMVSVYVDEDWYSNMLIVKNPDGSLQIQDFEGSFETFGLPEDRSQFEGFRFAFEPTSNCVPN